MGVSDETMRELGRHFDAAQVTELVVLTSLYEAIARLIQALGIEVEASYLPYLGAP